MKVLNFNILLLPVTKICIIIKKLYNTIVWLFIRNAFILYNNKLLLQIVISILVKYIIKSGSIVNL